MTGIAKIPVVAKITCMKNLKKNTRSLHVLRVPFPSLVGEEGISERGNRNPPNHYAVPCRPKKPTFYVTAT